jgi:hypothetical protein
MTVNHIFETVILDAFLAFIIPLVALLTSSPVMWCKEQLWNFSVHLYNRVTISLLLEEKAYKYEAPLIIISIISSSGIIFVVIIVHCITGCLK